MGAADPVAAQTAAPPVHPGTKLAFPTTLGGAQLQSSATATAGKKVTYDYHYLADGMPIAVFVFDSDRRVPNGASHPLIIDQFTGELEFVEKQVRGAGLGNFERPPVPSNCTYGSVTFRCIAYSASSHAGRIHSKLLLTGFRDSFVRIHIDWTERGSQNATSAERALQAFIPALMR